MTTYDLAQLKQGVYHKESGIVTTVDPSSVLLIQAAIDTRVDPRCVLLIQVARDGRVINTDLQTDTVLIK